MRRTSFCSPVSIYIRKGGISRESSGQSGRDEMSWICDLSDGRKACLYTDRNRILFYTFPGRNGGVPAVIKDDHESGMSAFLYYGTIYFTYINTEKELIFDGIGGGEEINLGKAQDIKAGPDLAEAAGNIFLFSMRRGDENEPARIEALDPYGTGSPILVTEGKEISGYRLVQSGNSVIVLTFCRNEIEEEIIWREGRFQGVSVRKEWAEKEQLEKDCSLLRRKMQEQEREQRTRLEMEQYRNSELEKTLEKYREEIMYAKQKYDELAGFAGRLQEAVKQWREKYMEEI